MKKKYDISYLFWDDPELARRFKGKSPSEVKKILQKLKKDPDLYKKILKKIY